MKMSVMIKSLTEDQRQQYEQNKTKQCSDCDKTYKLSEFYRAGKSWQARCKPCHNNNRLNYARSYVKRPLKYSQPDFMEKVKELRNEKKKWRQISKELEIPYASIMRFKTLNKIL